MITEEQVRKAASRYRRWKSGDCSNPYKSPYFNCDGDDPAYINRDRLILADAYIAELARREAERAERAKPIDAEWCSESCDAVVEYGDTAWTWIIDTESDVRLFVWDDFSCGIWWRDDVCTDDWNAVPSTYNITTRGQLLDLRAALKGGA